MCENICICLLGVDGSGKTTIANAYLKYLDDKNILSIHVWSRYRNYLSKPFLALMRITGHNRKEVINEVKIGYHDFSNNPLIAYSFLALQWIDQCIDIFLRFNNKKIQIVSDRCIIDTLVDLCIDTGRDDFILGNYGHSLKSLMPENTAYFIINRSKELVYASRPDVKVDKDYERRVKLYKRVAKVFDLDLICNDGTVEESLSMIYKKVK